MKKKFFMFYCALIAEWGQDLNNIYDNFWNLSFNTLSAFFLPVYSFFNVLYATKKMLNLAQIPFGSRFKFKISHVIPNTVCYILLWSES